MGLVFFCETYQEILFALVWKVFQDYVLLFLNSYYFFSFILESGCFCSKWLLKFIVNCLHHFFFALKHRSLQTIGTQRSLTSCYSEALCSPATPQHILWWEMTLLVSYPTDPLPLFPKDLGTAGFTMEAYETTQSLLREESPTTTVTGSYFPPSLGSSSGSPCTVHCCKAPLLLLGWRRPCHKPFQDLQLCLCNEALQCRERPLSMTTCSEPQLICFILSTALCLHFC